MNTQHTTALRRKVLLGSLVFSTLLTFGGVNEASSQRHIYSFVFGDIADWPPYMLRLWPVDWVLCFVSMVGFALILVGAVDHGLQRSDRLREAGKVVPITDDIELPDNGDYSMTVREFYAVLFGGSGCLFTTLFTPIMGWYIGIESGLFCGLFLCAGATILGLLIHSREWVGRTLGISTPVTDLIRWLRSSRAPSALRAARRWLNAEGVAERRSAKRSKAT